MTRDALCGVTADGPLATKLASGCRPRAGGLGRRQGSRDSGGAPCALCGSAQLAWLWGWHGDPFLTPWLGQCLSGPAPWDTVMSPLTRRGCAHRKNILGNAVSFQVLSLLMAFAARERMINLYAITATSFWYHHTQALCHRPAIGVHWVEEGYFTAGHSAGFGQFGALKYVFCKQFRLEGVSCGPESNSSPYGASLEHAAGGHLLSGPMCLQGW